MKRFLFLFICLSLVALSLALLRIEIWGASPALEAEAMAQQLFWQSEGYVRNVALGWYPAMSAWISLPVHALAGDQDLALLLLAGGVMLVLLGHITLWRSLPGELPQAERLCLLILGGLCLGLLLWAPSMQLACLIFLFQLVLYGLLRLQRQVDTIAISLLTLLLVLLPMHSAIAAMLALVLLSALMLWLARRDSPRNRVIMLLWSSAVLIGFLTVTYLQAFFGDPWREVLRQSLLSADLRPLPSFLTLTTGSALGAIAVFLTLAFALAAFALRPVRLGAVLAGGALVLWVSSWMVEADQQRYALQSQEPAFDLPLPVKATVLAETAALPPAFVKRQGLGRFTLPHSDAFRAVLSGVTPPHTYALAPTKSLPSQPRDRLSTLLDRHEHRIVQQSPGWTLYHLIPQQEAYHARFD